MTDTTEAREYWGEEIGRLRSEVKLSEEEVDRLLADDDLWILSPYLRHEGLTGAKPSWRTARAWDNAAKFTEELMQLADYRGMFADGTAAALSWLMQDAYERAREAARRERERLEQGS